MTKKQKQITLYLYIFYYIFLIGATLYCAIHQMEGLKMAWVAAFTCFLVPLALKIVKLKPTFEIYLINVVFAFVASICGSMLGAYSLFMFDKVLHFSSGLFLTTLSFMIFSFLKKTTCVKEKNERILSIIFVNACNMMMAVFWEFFEYGCLIFLNNDAINHYTSGVHDTMTDMLVACLGGLIVSGYIISYYRTQKKNFWIRVNENFYQENFKKN